MNRNEQHFYNDVKRGATALEKIANLLEGNLHLFNPGRDTDLFESDDSDSYDASSDHSESSLKDMIADIASPHDRANGLAEHIEKEFPLGYENLIKEASSSVDRLKEVNESLDSFFSIRPEGEDFVDGKDIEPKLLQGEITQLMLQFVAENPGCRYTDINRFNHVNIHGNETFDTYEQRGRFAHHCKNLRSPSTRRCKVKYYTGEGMLYNKKLAQPFAYRQWIEKDADTGGYYYRDNNNC